VQPQVSNVEELGRTAVGDATPRARRQWRPETMDNPFDVGETGGETADMDNGDDQMVNNTDDDDDDMSVDNDDDAPLMNAFWHDVSDDEEDLEILPHSSD
jgi:hypothetical protein